MNFGARDALRSAIRLSSVARAPMPTKTQFVGALSHALRSSSTGVTNVSAIRQFSSALFLEMVAAEHSSEPH